MQLSSRGELLVALRSKQTQDGAGARIARFRRERGLSQTELGEKIGVSQRVMSHYEKAQTRIPADVLLKIADVLKISVYELLGRASSNRAPKNKKLWKVIDTLESLPPRDQRVVLRTIDAIARDAGARR
jgi:transcriptional regulator with XRE-family HTH domain